MPNLASGFTQYAARLAMFKFTIAMVLLAAAFLQGCAAARTAAGVPPTDLTQVQVGATAKEIESALGPPIANQTIDGKGIDVHQYTRGVESKPSLWFVWPLFVLQPGTWAWVEYCNLAEDCDIKVETEARRAERALAIIYEPGGTAIYFIEAPTVEAAFEASETWVLAIKGDPEAQYRMGSIPQTDKAARRKWLILAAEQGHAQAMYELGRLSNVESAERRKWLLLAAEQGHAEAMYDLGDYSDAGSKEQWRWYCLAGMQGFAKAQSKLGRDYYSGDAPGGTDLSKALFWYTLSDTGGYVEGQSQYCYHDANVGYTCARSAGVITQLRSELADEDIAEVERLVAAWEPNPADCYEPDEVQAGN
jgi:TPR repeat protein